MSDQETLATRRWQDRRELSEAECRENRSHVRIMGEVKVERLVEREGSRVVVERQVGLSTFGVENMLLKTGENFSDVANANGSTGCGLEIVVAGER